MVGTKMKTVTSMRVNMQRQGKTDMKMQEETEEILGGRVWEVQPLDMRGLCTWAEQRALQGCAASRDAIS